MVRLGAETTEPPDDAEPRFHHYALAHFAIRQAALSNPLQYLTVMASPRTLTAWRMGGPVPEQLPQTTTGPSVATEATEATGALCA